jgi:hypothetical protein
VRRLALVDGVVGGLLDFVAGLSVLVHLLVHLALDLVHESRHDDLLVLVGLVV